MVLRSDNGDERPDGVGHAKGEEGREPVRPGDQQRRHAQAQHGRLQALAQTHFSIFMHVILLIVQTIAIMRICSTTIFGCCPG